MFIVPHEFQSITEEQWKSGRSRHCCATCRRDYSDSVHLPLLWSLVVTLEDVFVPRSAPYVVEGVASLDDHSCEVTIALFADEAGYNLQWQTN